MAQGMKKWTSLLLVFALVVTLFPLAPTTAQANSERITITGIYTKSTPDGSRPEDMNQVTRVTTSPITLTATIENISDSQLSGLYYEVTNMSTGQTSVITNAVPQRIGQFEIAFTNVALSEGLNKIVIKYGTTNVVSSAPGWVIFTPTVEIQDLQINGENFVDNRIYPSNPSLTTSVNITGRAPNANQVLVYRLGSPSPVTSYFNNGNFIIIADDINNPNATANLRLTPGDNFLTFVAESATRTYRTERNLVYDNGGPFAFNARIKQDGSDWMRLVENPTVTNPNVTVSALLKVDVNAAGQPAYQYVDVNISGQSYGPFNLGGATPATRVSSVSPNSLYQGHGRIYFAISGTSLDGITVSLRDRNGNDVTGLSEVADMSDESIRLYEFSGSLTEAAQPYTLTVRKNGDVIHNENIQVLTPPAGQPFATVNQINLSGDVHQGYTERPEGTVNFAGAVAASDLSMRVVRLNGQSAGAATFTTFGSQSQHQFELPDNLTEGRYKLQLLQHGRLLAELPFRVHEPLPLTPVVQGVFETSPANLSTGETYFSVRGQHFGTNIDDIINARLVNDADATDTIALETHEVRNDYIIFKVADQSALESGKTYYVEFEKVHKRDANGQVTDSETVASSAVISPEDPADHDVSAPVIESLTVNGNGELQFHQNDTTRTLTLTGTNLTSANMSNTYVEIWNAQGTMPVGANGAIDASSANGTSVNVTFPSSLEAGTYMVRIEYNNERVIGMFPITIVNPVATSYEVEGNTITLYGNFLGTALNENLYRLKLEPHDENLSTVGPLVPQSGSLRGDSIRFTLPSLEPGIYDIILMYNGNDLTNNVMTYSVTASAELRENATWTRVGRYKVYDFSVDLTIPSDRYQVIQFRFYNFDSDDAPTSTFWFNYEDPTLPYVDFVTSGSAGFRLSETVPNEISEQPLELNIYTNDKAEGVDVYLGDYSANAEPDAYSEEYTTDSNYPGYRVFRVTLSGIDNGLTDLTVVPYTGSVNSGNKVVNESGKRTYQLRISSTPYIIVDNLYNGQMIRNETEELVCQNPVQARCVSGRLVNVPLDNTGELASNVNVRVWFNDSELNPNALDMDNTYHGNFRLQLPAAFVEGRNTLKFGIYIGGVLVTETTIEFFRFSTEAPQFIHVAPVDDGEVQRFLPGTVESSYVTSEKGVVFRGQFANATSIELTVRTRDENGNPIVRTDRRYGSNFNSREPINDNPQFFRNINASNGRFETNEIPLATGDTVFEFTISNESNITVTRTITINREPRPYVILSPRLVKNARGEDQANINKNFVMVEIEAEGADEVIINREVAGRREVTDNTGVTRTIFYHEIRNIRPGRPQKVDFTVVRGTQSVSGSFQVFNAGTPIEGAQYKTTIANRINVFDGQLQLTFPRNTYLMRNDPTKVNQFITRDRQILFGIANKDDGRVDKWKHPAAEDGQLDNPNPLVTLEGRLLLAPPPRFRPASNLFWIDAGTIRDNPDDLEEAYTGSGRLPYEHERFYARNEDDLVVPTNVGTLTIKYDPNIRNEAWRYVTVFHYDIFEDHNGNIGYRWRNLGGVVDTRNNTITVPLERFGYYQVMYMDRSYDDVIAHPWARHDLDTMISKGYMVAKEPDRFIPNDPIIRGEFATLLVKIFDIPLQYPSNPKDATFTDVPRYNPHMGGLYDFRYIETAARAGIIRGTTGGMFNPDRAITREEAAVMIARAANLRLNNDPNRVLRSLQASFTDANLIDVYARPAVEAVYRAGLITGKENVLLEGQNRPTYRFDPKETMTRAEAASIALRVLAQQKKIPR